MLPLSGEKRRCRRDRRTAADVGIEANILCNSPCITAARRRTAGHGLAWLLLKFQANRYGEQLRARLNEELARAGAPWAVYGAFSGFHTFLNPKRRPLDPTRFDPLAVDYRELSGNPKPLAQKIRLALLVNGVVAPDLAYRARLI
jgi:hypothetical protein